MKKVLSLLLTLVLTVTVTLFLAGCEGGYKDDGVFRVGIITLHDENSTYDKNFIDAAKEVKKALNLTDEQVIIKSGIPEGNECYNEAVKLVKQGCDVIFADSFGHEDYLIKAAKKYTKVQFCHATGTQAHTAGLDNFHNAFASIYEGRYLAGVAAGIKLNAMINAPVNPLDPSKAIIGYVGAFTYAEVMSGYTSFFLGAKSVCPSVTMKVSFTGSWYDYAKEKEIAKKLIEDEGCVLISQHADSQGCPEACEAAGVPNVFYNGTNEAKTTWLASSKIDWAPYFTIIMDANKQDQIPTDYTGTITTGSVKYYLDETDYDIAADNALGAYVDDEHPYSLFLKAEADIKAGTVKVFDTNTFTVKGEKITTYMADVDTDKDFTADTEAIEGGIFTESSKRSAPYFNIEIDGITLLDRNYGD